jgi:hypothetical protein
MIYGEVVIYMRGKKLSDQDVYNIMTSYAVTNNLNETARELGLAVSTVKGIVDKNINKEEFEKLRTQKKEEFADKASTIIDKGLELIDRRLSMALDKQDELDKLIDEIEVCDDEEMSYQHKISAINLIRETQIQKIKDITTAIGTLYDKRALARGETTQNIDFATNSETLGKLLEIAGYSKVKEDD